MQILVSELLELLCGLFCLLGRRNILVRALVLILGKLGLVCAVLIRLFGFFGLFGAVLCNGLFIRSVRLGSYLLPVFILSGVLCIFGFLSCHSVLLFSDARAQDHSLSPVSVPLMPSPSPSGCSGSSIPPTPRER